MSQRLLSAGEQYFEQNCTKLICYDDLRPYLDYLSDKDQEDLRLHCAAYAKSKAPVEAESEVSRTRTQPDKLLTFICRLRGCRGWHQRSMP